MKKLFISLIFVALTASVAMAQTVTWIIPFTPGGSSSTISSVIIPAMAKKGWEINAKFAGDCVTARDAIENTNSPIMYHWLNLWQRDASEACYWGKIKSNYLFKIAAAESLLCNLKDDTSIFENTSDTLRVGIRANNEFLPAWQKMMDDATPAHLRFANYPNGSTMKAGVASGELDYIFSTDGKSLLKNHLAKSCEYHSGDYKSDTYKHISDKLPDFPAFESTLDLYTQNIKDIDKFKADLQDVLQSEKYQSTLSNIGRYLK